MLRTIWRFRAKVNKKNDFQLVYGWKGNSTKLFGRSPEYQGTILLQDVGDHLIFIVIDRWAERNSFANFREKFASEYKPRRRVQRTHGRRDLPRSGFSEIEVV
jgi:hypothetical protein